MTTGKGKLFSRKLEKRLRRKLRKTIIFIAGTTGTFRTPGRSEREKKKLSDRARAIFSEKLCLDGEFIQAVPRTFLVLESGWSVQIFHSVTVRLTLRIPRRITPATRSHWLLAYLLRFVSRAGDALSSFRLPLPLQPAAHGSRQFQADISLSGLTILWRFMKVSALCCTCRLLSFREISSRSGTTNLIWFRVGVLDTVCVARDKQLHAISLECATHL